MMSLCQISIMSTHLTTSNRFPSTRMEVQQDVAMCDVINLVDSKDAWEEAEMSRRYIAGQQDVDMCADSKDAREVAEMSGSCMAVGEDVIVHDMITPMDSKDVREAEMSGSHPVTTRVKYRMSRHTSCAGILLSFPPGRNEHTSYPFVLTFNQCVQCVWIWGWSITTQKEVNKSKKNIMQWRRYINNDTGGKPWGSWMSTALKAVGDRAVILR